LETRDDFNDDDVVDDDDDWVSLSKNNNGAMLDALLAYGFLPYLVRDRDTNPSPESKLDATADKSI